MDRIRRRGGARETAALARRLIGALFAVLAWAAALADAAAECPEGHEAFNSRCWDPQATPYLLVQNKFMEDYAKDGTFARIVVHKLVFHCKAGDLLDTPLANVSVRLTLPSTVAMPVAMHVDVPNAPMSRRLILEPGNSHVVYSDVFGRISLGILPIAGQLSMPPLLAHAAFMPDGEFALVHPDQALLHRIGAVSTADVRKMMPAENNLTLGLEDREILELQQTLQRLVQPLTSYQDPVGSRRLGRRGVYPQRKWQLAQVATDRMWDARSNVLWTPVVAGVDYDASARAVVFSQDLPPAENSLVRRNVQRLRRRTLLGSALGITSDGSNPSIIGRFAHAIVEQGKWAWSSVVDTAGDVYELLAGVLQHVRITLKRVWAVLVSLFRWDDVLVSAQFVEGHLRRMPALLESYYKRSTSGLFGWVETLPLVKASLVASATDQPSDATPNSSATDDLMMTNETTLQDVIFMQKQLAARMQTPSNSGGRFERRSLAEAAPETQTTVLLPYGEHSGVAVVSKNVSLPPDVQQGYLQNLVAVEWIAESPERTLADVQDAQAEKSWAMIVESLRTNYQQIHAWSNNATVQRQMALVKEQFKHGLRTLNMHALVDAVTEFLRLQAGHALQVLHVLLSEILDAFVSVCDKILRTPVRLPFITRFYESVLVRNRSPLTLYGLLALTSSLEANVLWKTFGGNSAGLLSQRETTFLLNVDDPSSYVRNYAASGIVPASLRHESRARSLRERLRLLLTVTGIQARGFSSLVYIPNLLREGRAMMLYSSVRIPLMLPLDFVQVVCGFPFGWIYGLPRDSTELVNSMRFYLWSLSWIRPILLAMRVLFLPIDLLRAGPSTTFGGRVFVSLYDMLEVVISYFEGIYEMRLLHIGTENTVSDHVDVVLKAFSKMAYAVPGLVRVWLHNWGIPGTSLAAMQLAAMSLEKARLVTAVLSGAVCH